VQGHCTELLSLIDAQRAATETARQTAASATAEARKLAARDEAWAQQQRNWQRERADLLARLDGVGGYAPMLNSSSSASGSFAYFQTQQHNHQPVRSSSSSGGGYGAYPTTRASYHEHATSRARPPLAAASAPSASAAAAAPKSLPQFGSYNSGGIGLPGAGAAEAFRARDGNGKEN